MSTKRYTETVTLVVSGDEADYDIRAEVLVEGAGTEAYVDGPIQVLIAGVWVDIDDVDTTHACRDHAEEALTNAALEDDSDQCVEHDDAWED